MRRFKTIRGKFLDNTITSDNETIEAITYGIVREQIQGKYCYFLLKWVDTYECWVVINWVEVVGRG